MSTLTELGNYLEAASIATQANDLFLGSRPDAPDTVLVLYEYAAGEPEYVQDSFFPNAERVQVQVVSRAYDYEDAYRLIHRAWSALAVITNATLSGTRYRSVRPNSSPTLMGRDSHDRIMLVFNATVEKEVSLVL